MAARQQHMKYAILVYGSPFSREASDTAYHFSRAAIDRGHQIYRVFFYHDGVYNANGLAAPPRDETDIVSRWSSLAEDHQVDLVICVASALRRGILNATEAARYEKPGASLAPGFNLSGLGQLIDAGLNADRLVTFGN